MTLLRPAHEIGPNPLSEHALSHVMSEVLDSYAPTDEEEMRIELRQAGYRPAEVAQVMAAWTEYWEKTPQCSICGAKATCRWGEWNLETGEVHSMVGVNKLAPSCDQCAGRVDGQTVILADVNMTDFGPISPESEGAQELQNIYSVLVDPQDRDLPMQAYRRVQQVLQEIRSLRKKAGLR